MIAPLAGSLALLAALSAPAATPSPGRCSSDSFTVEGVALSVQICADNDGVIKRTPAGRSLLVNVTEMVSSKQRSSSRPVTLEFLADAETSRTIDDLPITAFAAGKTLHLTIAYRAGAIVLEHALVIPGGHPLK